MELPSKINNEFHSKKNPFLKAREKQKPPHTQKIPIHANFPEKKSKQKQKGTPHPPRGMEILK